MQLANFGQPCNQSQQGLLNSPVCLLFSIFSGFNAISSSLDKILANESTTISRCIEIYKKISRLNRVRNPIEPSVEKSTPDACVRQFKKQWHSRTTDVTVKCVVSICVVCRIIATKQGREEEERTLGVYLAWLLMAPAASLRNEDHAPWVSVFWLKDAPGSLSPSRLKITCFSICEQTEKKHPTLLYAVSCQSGIILKKQPRKNRDSRF